MAEESIGSCVGGVVKEKGSEHAHSGVTEDSELERELRRKDKALAEAAALLVLKKKLAVLWEDEDDSTRRSNGS